MVGFSLAGADLLAVVCSAVERRFPKAALWQVTVVVITAALGIATTQRNLVYRSEVALWSDSVAKAPQNPRGHHNLGYAYELNGNLPLAVQEYRIALSFQPGNARYLQSLKIAQGKVAADIVHGKEPR
jgi:Tfp pilus assembly protein PilF